MTRWLLWCCLICSFAHGEQQGSAHTVPDASGLSIRYQLLHSPSSLTLSFVSAPALSSGLWQPIERLSSYGFTTGEYWIKMQVANQGAEPLSKVVRFTSPVHDYVDVYQFNEQNHLLHTWFLGDQAVAIERPIPDKHAAFPLNLEPDQSTTFYIRVAGINAMVLSLEVISHQQHEHNKLTSTIITGLVYGVLLAMVLYNLGIAVSIRDHAYFIYVTYVACFIVFLLCLTGDGYYFLWSNSTRFNEWGLSLISGILILPSILFPIYLLDIKNYAPKIALLLRSFILMGLIYLLLMPLMGAGASLKVINLLSIFITFSMLFVGIYLSFKRVPLAMIYTISWFILLLGLAVLPLSSLNIIESNQFTRHANLLGGVVESILLSLALAQRFRNERKDKLEAMNRELMARLDAQRSRAMYEGLFKQSPVGIFRFSEDGKLLTANPALITMLDFTDEQDILKNGDTVRELFHNWKELGRKTKQFGRVIDEETTVTMFNITKTFSISMSVIQTKDGDVYEGFVSDISERKLAEQVHKLMENERMASMEQLVTGVAHEINTPIGTSVTSISYLKDLLVNINEKMVSGVLTKNMFREFMEDGKQVIEIIGANMQVISNLVRRFKMVSIKQMDIEKADIPIQRHIQYIIDNSFFINKKVDVRLSVIGAETIKSYPAAWQIIIDQLIENSMVHGFSEHIVNPFISIALLQQDDHWELYYQDNGVGVQAKVIDKIFEPFVTTKRGNSENAGLGLYRVYNVITQVLNGHIELVEGTGFQCKIIFKAEAV